MLGVCVLVFMLFVLLHLVKIARFVIKHRSRRAGGNEVKADYGRRRPTSNGMAALMMMFMMKCNYLFDRAHARAVMEGDLDNITSAPPLCVNIQCDVSLRTSLK